MARKRMIDPGIWQSEDFGKLSNLAKIVFIGLFSLADDDGRGRANPTYLKSTLFPYNESMRSADVEVALSEISRNMSVILYSYDESYYYDLLSWDKFQKIEKPKDSQIPMFEGNNDKFRRLFHDQSTTNRRLIDDESRLKEKNRKENNRKRKEEFIAPTLQEVEEYVKAKRLKVNANQFFTYFSEGGWIDSNGHEVKNWKQKLLTWNGFIKPVPKIENKNFSNYEKREYDNLNGFYAN